MDVSLAYDRPTTVVTEAEAATVALAVNRQRGAVAFAGRAHDPLLLRQLLLAQHACASNDARGAAKGWLSEADWRQTLDPIMTVHPDQLSFESFSNDGSCYARLTAPLAAFEVEGQPTYGTTNVDFTWDMRPALNTLRSGRDTSFRIGGDGAATLDQYARTVAVKNDWLKGFLQVQGALTMPAFSFDVRPVDLVSIITYLGEHRARRSPQDMRFEFLPDQEISVVLEPWKQRFSLRGTYYRGYERVVRLWGRTRLAMLGPVLPYADRVTVAVLGRGLPHIYICHCGPYQFMLALSGWAANDWAMGSGFDLLAAFSGATADLTRQVSDYLGTHLAASQEEIAAATGVPQDDVARALFQLCRAGRVLYDLTAKQYRQRDLFEEPLDLAALFTSDPRLEAAQKLLEANAVFIRGGVGRGGARRIQTRVVATVHDDIDYSVTVLIDENGRMRFGSCQCAFFQLNNMSKGPCEHILATRLAFDSPATVAEATQTIMADEDDDSEDTDEELADEGDDEAEDADDGE